MSNSKLSKKELSVIPNKGDKYYYVFSSMSTFMFEVRDTDWCGNMSDKFRLVKGNVFIDRNEAVDLAREMNDYLAEINKTVI